ncbi:MULTISPECIES: hypothetical protein [Hydrogenophaga]|jgi:hypothetical protein|uniref:Uncharacterized protein n=1 Tax=Hydrogenophaga pseudoflava TaxID=47421 RepID=A0A4P6X2A2_HYDPS|nr:MULTISPECIES: hypothetical protein [Hydrogenophaga]OPF61807.1 hypothetical protein BC358_17375 [Hydrogenophaga sp. H7]QBM29269.1 hypothetical protein HPF_16370 [Hydrogenophaga pseudoflava]
MIAVLPLCSERSARRWRVLGALLLSVPLLGGCAVIAVADVAASAVVGVAGLAVDAAVGTARIGGKIIGAGADAVLDDDEDEATDD